MENTNSAIVDDLVSGNINSGHLLKFLKKAYRKKHIGIFIYLGMLLYICIWMMDFFSGTFSNNNSLKKGILLFLLSLVLSTLFLNGFGQALLRIIIGAKKIERSDFIETYKLPVDKVIAEARQKGLTLPDQIQVYLLESDKPIAYAFGMNSIAVTKALLDLPEDLFKAKVSSELYRIHEMDPDYLLFMIGSNLLSVILALFVMGLGASNMEYGDSRHGWLTGSERESGAMLFALFLVMLVLWIGICYLLIRGIIRKNQFDADLYAADCGYGEAMCMYLDKCSTDKVNQGLKILELGHPSSDQRISALQGAGVSYSA